MARKLRERLRSLRHCDADAIRFLIRQRLRVPPTPAPLSAIARWKSPLASGDAVRLWTALAPADCPATVTREGSPPNAAMLSCTHRTAAI